MDDEILLMVEQRETEGAFIDCIVLFFNDEIRSKLVCDNNFNFNNNIACDINSSLSTKTAPRPVEWQRCSSELIVCTP